MTRPIGTLIQKIQCQEMPCTTAPPTSGPSATAIPLTPDHTPIAMPRRSRERLGEQRERQRGDDRRARALDGARGHEQPGARRERGGGRGRA